MLFPILLFSLALIPTTFWFFIFLREEKYDPIPKKLITKVFLLGAVGAVFASVLEISIVLRFPPYIRETFLHLEKVKTLGLSLAVSVIALTILLACIEEVLKISVVKFAAYSDKNFNQVIDGAVLGVSTALGFATLENLAYFFQASEQGIVMLVFVFFVRFLATTLLHATATGIAGYFLGKEKFTGEKGLFFKGLFAAMLTHATFNLFLLGGVIGLFLNIFFLLTLFIFLLRRMESTEAQTIWKLIFFRPTYSSSSLTGSSKRL